MSRASRVISILTELRPEFDFSESENFLDEGMLDSFDVVMLVTQLDESFDIAIEGTDVVPENFKSVADIEQLLKKYGVDA